ncbi:MAG: molybdopterin-guanine dinucleotide biosynthesis protein B, partial [bacterium]|nr:molybdopterin-guanine dinucleotide biosynthesis protein B [bacterium]
MSEAIADWSCEPIVVVSGYSGSGKTTLLEAAIPRLTSCGLRVAAIKHDAHGLKLDTEGKDSYRLFRAGADVMVSGPEESALRRHSSDQYNLDDTLALLLRDHDVVLVEGHKATPLPKVWLA